MVRKGGLPPHKVECHSGSGGKPFLTPETFILEP